MTERYSFSTAERTALDIARASTLYDGTLSEPRLGHPEGVAVGPGGSVWCGTELGGIMRIDPSGKGIEKVADTGGFILGLAFHGDRALFCCDLKEKAVFRLDLETGKIERFTEPGISVPNYPAVDVESNRLFVSDSREADSPGPSVWAYDLDTGKGGVWNEAPLNFANGLAVREGERALYVCETFARRVTRIPIEDGGGPGEAEAFASDLPGLPDGLAFDRNGGLVISCYEPSRILRASPDGSEVEVLIEDPTAHVFCHPTNVAFDGDVLYSANLGRWHITKVEMDVGAEPLWQAVARQAGSKA